MMERLYKAATPTRKYEKVEHPAKINFVGSLNRLLEERIDITIKTAMD
jgi:hypothetical protein